MREFLGRLAGRGTQVSFVSAPHGNVNTGAVHGGQTVTGGTGPGARRGEGRVREGAIPDTEVRDAALGFVRPDCFGDALARLEEGPLFLTGRAGTGRRTTALNLLRASCGDTAPLRALDGVTELDRWKPADDSVRGYLMDGLFPSRPLSPAVLGHTRELLRKARARMVIVLPDDAALLRHLERGLHISPVVCVPPPPSLVFDRRFEAMVPDQRERDRLLAALNHQHDLDELLVPELVPAEVVELVTAVVAADGDPAALDDLGLRLSYRAEQEATELVRDLRGDPDSLAFLLAASVYEGQDHRIVRDEADRLAKLAADRLTAVLPGKDADGASATDRPNPAFVFRRSLTEQLHAVRAVRQEREIKAGDPYAHSVEAVAFVRHQQAETVLRHVWREYGQLVELLVEWLRDVPRTGNLAEPAGRTMGRAASWGGGRNALAHLREFAVSNRATGRAVAAKALGIAAEDPVLVPEVRHRLQEWSTASSPCLRATVALACGEEFGLARPDLALRFLDQLLLGTQGRDDEKPPVREAVETSVLKLFQAGHEAKVFHLLLRWSEGSQGEQEQVLPLFTRMLTYPQWFVRNLSRWTPEAQALAGIVALALNTESSFDRTCASLLRWAEDGQWDEAQYRAVENLFLSLAHSMRSGEFRLFVEMERTGSDGWPGLVTARKALDRWRTGDHEGAA